MRSPVFKELTVLEGEEYKERRSVLYIGSQMSKVTGSGAGNWEILGKKKE